MTRDEKKLIKIVVDYTIGQVCGAHNLDKSKKFRRQVMKDAIDLIKTYGVDKIGHC